MQIDTDHSRTELMAHYVIAHTEPSTLGATKLNKVLWCADVLHYRKYGRTISNQDSYRRMQNGPVPHDIVFALNDLKSSGCIVERSSATPVGTRREFFSLKRPNTALFDPEEVETLHEAINEVCPLSAAQASERTHGPIWRELNSGERMPIRAAAVIPGEVTEEDLQIVLAHKDQFLGD